MSEMKDTWLRPGIFLRFCWGTAILTKMWQTKRKEFFPNGNMKDCAVWISWEGTSEDGGGGRIRTFEVDDGRFTVCSLWPLGNPARGISYIGFLARILCQEAGRIISNEAPL